MRLGGKRGWILLLSVIIIAVGLFTSFKLAGMMSQQPRIVQIIPAHDTLFWSAERPDMTKGIEDNLSSEYAGDINVSQYVFVADYLSEGLGAPGISFGIRVVASVQSGYVYELNFTARPQDSPNTELAYYTGYYPSNGSVATGLREEGLSGIDSTSPDGVSFEAVGFGSQQRASLEWALDWLFHGPQDETYTLGMTSQVVYYDGNVFKSVVQDYSLKFEPRVNNTFATAVELQGGNYTRLYLGGEPEAAYYKIYTNNGQRVMLDINGFFHSTSIVFDVTIYNPDGTIDVPSQTGSYEYSANFLANSTGYWIFRVTPDPGYGFYAIGLSIS